MTEPTPEVSLPAADDGLLMPDPGPGPDDLSHAVADRILVDPTEESDTGAVDDAS